MIERGHHDMGGQPAGKVERTEHDYPEWERRVDAMVQLLRSGRKITVDELRKNIEALPPQAYDQLSDPRTVPDPAIGACRFAR